ncbi:MAG: hypothetical protein KL785_00470 [Brevundimonas sp.]|nr:hypothetical protein [Brevundimonas sp.]
MLAEKHGEAVILLHPLANAAHGGAGADMARALMERAKGGQPPLSPAELEAVATAGSPDEGDAEPDGAGEDDEAVPPEV